MPPTVPARILSIAIVADGDRAQQSVFLLPGIPGNDLPGVIGFRDITDRGNHAPGAAARTGKTSRGRMPIGGGLLGLPGCQRPLHLNKGCTSHCRHNVLDTLMERPDSRVVGGRS
ncbi:MAG: hypothetical protein R3F44_01435 [Candidatus Competibacteraceae bacterium]